MFAVNNNVRYRFNDSDRKAQIVISFDDYSKMRKKLMKSACIDRDTAETILGKTFYQEIVRMYGIPSKLTVILTNDIMSVQ